MLAAAVAGPGLIAVGSDNTAWYSEDGLDWSLAEVPPPPTESFQAVGLPAPIVEMRGLAVAGDRMVAWGSASAEEDGVNTIDAPVLWASSDGRSWANVLDARMDGLRTVAGGPGGFVAVGDASEDVEPRSAIWFSADGQAWERAAVNDEGMPVSVHVSSAAATSAGYVAVGIDNGCPVGPCPSGEAVIWTSADGRSWSRLQSDELFAVTDPRDPGETFGASANVAVAWGSQFVVGGFYDGKPAIWISDPAPSGGDANAIPPAAEGTPTPIPTEAIAFIGSWEATDPPPDSSQLTMEVVALADGTHSVTIRDDLASVCGGESSTMTGVAEVGEPGTVVIEQPEYVCDGGSQPQALSGPPLEEQIQNLGFAYDARRDELQDSLGLVWSRVVMGP
jgi:hypothetical protein